MCGIAGFVHRQGHPVDETVGRRMIEMLRHRGPDGDGQFVSGDARPERSPSVFLGHRRLKIIDLSDAARQPLANEDETVWVVLNGEIYNFPELRRDLEGRGHVFRSRSDTEVIVHAYEEYGDGCVARLDGMFAFALWDDRRRRLLLARDRTGKKPLYYAADGSYVTFASEIKALMACPWVRRAVSAAAIPEYLTLGYVRSPRTLYDGIAQVAAGSYVVVDRAGVGEPRRYWQIELGRRGDPERWTDGEASRRVRDLLRAAVRRRLISDVPLGALLSGGLDSSIVVGLMASLSERPVRTFSIGFTDDPSYDERVYASRVARHFRTEHTEFVLKADAVSVMERLLWHHDQPYGDASAIPTYYVAQLAREHVTVALNGDGADEVFAGYDRFVAALLAERVPRALVPVGRAVARGLPRGQGYFNLRRRLERFLEAADAPVEERFVNWMAFFDAAALSRLLRPEVAGVPGVHAELQRLLTDSSLPLLHRLLLVNFLTYLPDDLHVKMDRMSMAHSLETRSPMLDTALVEFVASLPAHLKIHRGQTKYLLRHAFRDMLPREVLKRRKQGFEVPLNHWFRGQLRAHVEAKLLAPDARSRAYLRADAVRALYVDHMSGTVNRGHQLWVLLNLECWLRMLEDGRLGRPWEGDPAAEVARMDAPNL